MPQTTRTTRVRARRRSVVDGGQCAQIAVRIARIVCPTAEHPHWKPQSDYHIAATSCQCPAGSPPRFPPLHRRGHTAHWRPGCPGPPAARCRAGAGPRGPGAACTLPCRTAFRPAWRGASPRGRRTRRPRPASSPDRCAAAVHAGRATPHRRFLPLAAPPMTSVSTAGVRLMPPSANE